MPIDSVDAAQHRVRTDPVRISRRRPRRGRPCRAGTSSTASARRFERRRPGTVLSVEPDPITLGRTSVQLEHVVGTHHYRTHLHEPRERRQRHRGRRAGAGGSDDWHRRHHHSHDRRHAGHVRDDAFSARRLSSSIARSPNPKAVSPEPFLSAGRQDVVRSHLDHGGVLPRAGRAVRDQPARPRFPASRTWTRAGGDGPAGIRFTGARARADLRPTSCWPSRARSIEIGTSWCA